MKTLNRHGKEIFCLLIDSLKGGHQLKIENEPYMPLTIEKVGENIDTNWGEVSLYSLCDHYMLNSELMRDIKMYFIVVDHRQKDLTVFGKVKIMPYMYQQGNIGIYGERLSAVDNELDKYDRTLQLQHVVFGNNWLQNVAVHWLKNIDTLGFLKTNNKILN